jgi:DNA-binding GntR family transcriptional regulator
MSKPRSETPLARPANLSERIYSELRLRLQRQPLGADDRLLDLEVAAAYGTSRMPARDALLRLVNEGYLVGTTRGFAAPALSLDDIREIFEVRRLLEPHAIASVAATMDEATITQLTQALHRAQAAAAQDDGEEMVLANMAFRDAWLSHVANKRLATTIGRFVDHVQTVRLNTLSHAETRRIVLDGLVQLHQALVQRDGMLIRERMTAFMRAAEHAFFSTHQAGLQGAPDDAPEPPAAA